MKTFNEYSRQEVLLEASNKKFLAYGSVVYLILTTTNLKPKNLAKILADELDLKTEKDYKKFESYAKGALKAPKYREMMQELRKITHSAPINEFEEMNELLETVVTSVGSMQPSTGGWLGTTAGFILMCTVKLGVESVKIIGKLFWILLKYSKLTPKDLAQRIKRAYGIDSYEEIEKFKYNTKDAKKIGTYIQVIKLLQPATG